MQWWRAVEFHIDWDDFRLVRAVAETRSLAGAAQALGVNHSTIFRRLGALEETLGTRLFERHRAGYAATAAGEEMVALAERMADDVLGFERRVSGRDLRPTGELRVTASHTLLVSFLVPILAAFRRAHPGIRLDLVVTEAALNLSKRDADVALRATERPPETLVGRRLARIAWAIYGDPSVLDRPFDLAEAARYDWVGFGPNLSGLPQARWLTGRVPAERQVCLINNTLGLAECAAAGIGLALVPCFIADRVPGLKRLATPSEEFSTALWLLTHPDLRHTARVRAFLDFVAAEVGRHRAALEGEAVSSPAG